MYTFNISKAKVVEKVFANLAKIVSQLVAAYLHIISKLFYLHHCLLAVTGFFSPLLFDQITANQPLLDNLKNVTVKDSCTNIYDLYFLNGFADIKKSIH